MHQTSRTIASTAIQTDTIGRNYTFLLTCLCMAIILAGFAAQPMHAAVAKRFAYVADNVANQIDEFSITAATGALVALPGACVNTPAPGGPSAAVVDPTGRFLYVSLQLANTILVFPINPLTGCLGVPAPFPTLGFAPVSLAITPKDTFLYASDSGGGGAIDGFAINPVNGALIPVPLSPFAAGPNPSGIALDPVGSCVYVANNVVAGTITGFTFNNNGSLAPAGPPTPTGASPFGLALDIVGQFLFVTNSGINRLTSYPIIPGGGCALAPANPPLATGVNPHGVAVSPFGQVAYVANNGANTASSYLVNPVTGAVALNGAAKPTGNSPDEVTADQTGRFLYITDNLGPSVSGYVIAPATGILAPIATSPWVTGVGPVAIATTP